MKQAVHKWWLALGISSYVWVVQGDLVVTHPFCGVTHIARKDTSPRNVSMHILLIDLRAPGLRFKLTPPGGTRETVSQSTLGFINQEDAQIGINVHFYLPYLTPDPNAYLVGFAASEGIICSPFEPQPILTDQPDQSYAILPYAPALNIDRFNNASIIHDDPGRPDHRHTREPVQIWTAVSGSAQIVSNGLKTIPTYSGPPNGLNAQFGYSDTSSWYNNLNSRTAIGLSQDNQTLLLFTADYHFPESEGMKVGEMADLLIRDYQVYNALNLDGNGSTTLAMQDPVTGQRTVINDSSYAPLGRGVGSNLAVFAQPLVSPAMQLTIRLTPANGVLLSWIGDGGEWILEESTITNPPKWLRANVVSARSGDCVSVTLPRAEQARFYRLAKQQ
jgi:hypothetical protein